MVKVGLIESVLGVRACMRTYVHAPSLESAPHFAILWTLACQAARSTGFSRQEYWSGLAKLCVSETIFKH